MAARALGRAFLIAAASLLAATSCQDRSVSAYLEGIKATSSIRDSATPKSEDELRREIAAAKAEVERTIKASENLGTYYRLLGVAYMNRAMYGEAVDAFEQAIRLYPENEQLFYFAGLSAARSAKAQTDDAERLRLFSLAEKYYQRSLFLFPDLRQALFGLAVVYAMEINRPADAVPLLDRLLAKDTSNVEARMLLARAHVALANYEEALDQYGRIAASNVSAEIKKQAQDNAAEIEGRILGGTRK